MNRRSFLAAASSPVLLAPQSRAEAGFTPLFDGSSLAGWSIEHGPESAFYVKEGAIVVHENSGFPAWLRSEHQYENFDFQGEFFIRGWIDSGIYIHAPEHGRPTWCGMKISLFHQADEKPQPQSMGSIFPLIAPRKVNVRNKGEWNTFRILMDWPRLQVWMNGEMVHDLDVESVPELRWRLRRGYLGFESLSYPIRFRNLRVRELPAKEQWTSLYSGPADLAGWHVSDGKPLFEPVGGVLHSDGTGNLATNQEYRDFALQMYVRHAWHHNGGVLFRSEGKASRGRHYEIQLHDVEGAHYPTGSLYHYQRAAYPRIEPEKWWLLQLFVKDRWCLVRVNGDTVLENHELDNLEKGVIELQAHQAGRWTDYKHIRIHPL